MLLYLLKCLAAKWACSSQMTFLMTCFLEVLRFILLCNLYPPYPKMDDTWNMCADSLANNTITIKYKFSVSQFDDMLYNMLDIMARVVIFSYLHICVWDRDEWKTTFNIMYGLHKWLVIPILDRVFKRYVQFKLLTIFPRYHLVYQISLVHPCRLFKIFLVMCFCDILIFS